MWERKPRLCSLEGMGVGGWQDAGWGAAPRGHSRFLMILLRMVCSSLTLISKSCGRREDGTHPGEKLPCHAPEAPLHRAPTYLPCKLSEEGLEAVVDLLFREHLLDGGGGAGQGHPSPATRGQQLEAGLGPLISYVLLRLSEPHSSHL